MEAPVGTAFQTALFMKHEQAAFLMLERGGVDLTEQDYAGLCPVHRVVLNGFYPCLQLLLDKGVDIDTRGLAGFTPLHCAAYEGNIPMVQLLLERGAKANSLSNECLTPLRVNLECHGKPVITYSLLEANSKLCDSEAMVEKLLTVIPPRAWGYNARLLLAYGANIDAQQEESGLTPLMLALRPYCAPMVELFFEHGAAHSPRDTHGNTALFFATVAGSCSAVTKLLHMGADIDTTNDVGQTPLMYGIGAQQDETCALLLERGASTTARCDRGISVLLYALHNNMPLLAEHLIRGGVPLDARTPPPRPTTSPPKPAEYNDK